MVFVFYYYTPSIVAAVIFAALFLLGGIVHTYFSARYRARYFIAFIVGCLFEAVGYVFRALSHSNPLSLNFFIGQSILILVAPALFAATIYMVLGRMMRTLNAEHHSMIPIKWLTKIFVIGDVVSFFIQSAGGGLSASSSPSLGRDVILVGLIVQIILFVFFLVVALRFNIRLRAEPTPASMRKPWKKHINVLFGASTVILIRNIVRTVEYVQGNDGYIIKHEIFLYIFDACLIFSTLPLFAIIHPAGLIGDGKGRYTVNSADVELLSDGPVRRTFEQPKR